jgi:lysine-N-methylase
MASNLLGEITSISREIMSTLHPTKTIQAVQPRYAVSFGCIGGACEDNCCTGWSVHIDKKTFNAYRQSPSPQLADRIEKKLKRLRSLNSDKQYARIEMEPVTEACPFMEEKLCSVQREMGEDKLSNTCSSYPRSTRVFDGQHEQSLTLSCPEAARLALLQSDAMDFVESNLMVRKDNILDSNNKQGLTPALKSSVRVFALQLMRTEGIELWQKLAMLGFFCEQLTLTLKSGQHHRIPQLLDETTQMVTSGAMVEAIADLKPDYVAQATIFSSLWQLKINRKYSATQEAVQQAVSLGLGADPVSYEVTQQQLIDRYTSGVKRLPEALKSVPFLIENYVINDMFGELFPFGEESPDKHFLKLVTRMGLVRLMLAAQCNDPGNLPSPEQMARTVQVFCRRYQHDTTYAATVNSAFQNAGWSSLERIYRFLRT